MPGVSHARARRGRGMRSGSGGAILRRLRRAPGDRDDELRELARLALGAQLSVVLLRDDLVADREAEPRPLAGRLRREEGAEELVGDVVPEARAVVANPDLHAVADGPCPERDLPFVVAAGGAHLLADGVAGVGDDVQEDAAHVRGQEIHEADRWIEVLGDLDHEVGVPGAQPVVGEAGALAEDLVQVRRLGLVARGLRVHEHAPDDPIGALAVLGHLAQVVAQRGDGVLEAREHRRREPARRALEIGGELFEELEGQLGEVGDEVERIADLVRDAGRELAERREPLLDLELLAGLLERARRARQLVVPGAQIGGAPLDPAPEIVVEARAREGDGGLCAQRREDGDTLAREHEGGGPQGWWAQPEEPARPGWQLP